MRQKIMPEQKFEQLTVIRELPEKVRKEIAYECRCSCGEITVATKSQLLTGRKKSCGCARKKTPPNALDLTNRKFGDLSVIGRAGTHENGQALWLCECKCGNQKAFTATTLRRGEATSCGCTNPEKIAAARKTLTGEKSVDGVQVPLLQKKTRSDSKSGHKGIHIRNRGDKIYYEANIGVKGKRIWGPPRTTLAEAIADRKAFEEKYHKPYIEALEEKENENEYGRD